MIPRFTYADAEAAYDAWGCNCGPTALAAMTGLTLDEVRSHLSDFESKRYTNPTLMFAALASVGRPWRRIGTNWPSWGLVRVQWEGPWTLPGVPMGARYRQTHWIGAATATKGRGVFDINALANGSGWSAIEDWERVLVPAITSEIKRASGAWHVTHGVEIQR